MVQQHIPPFNPFLLGRFQTQPTNIHLFSFVSMQIQLQDKEFAEYTSCVSCTQKH